MAAAEKHAIVGLVAPLRADESPPDVQVESGDGWTRVEVRTGGTRDVIAWNAAGRASVERQRACA